MSPFLDDLCPLLDQVGKGRQDSLKSGRRARAYKESGGFPEQIPHTLTPVFINIMVFSDK